MRVGMGPTGYSRWFERLPAGAFPPKLLSKPSGTPVRHNLWCFAHLPRLSGYGTPNHTSGQIRWDCAFSCGFSQGSLYLSLARFASQISEGYPHSGSGKLCVRKKCDSKDDRFRSRFRPKQTLRNHTFAAYCILTTPHHLSVSGRFQIPISVRIVAKTTSKPIALR